MSKEAIWAVVQELESLPETDQHLVLMFLARLKQNRRNSNTSSLEHQSALSTRGELLVFTGQLEQPETDWIRMVREERDEIVMQAATGQLRP